MLPQVYMASQLGSTPADETIQTGTQSEEKVWLEVANLSPYVFELRDEAGQVRGLVGAFMYQALLLRPYTPTIALHAVATSGTQPIGSGSWAVYAGLTKHAPIALERFA